MEDGWEREGEGHKGKVGETSQKVLVAQSIASLCVWEFLRRESIQWFLVYAQALDKERTYLYGEIKKWFLFNTKAPDKERTYSDGIEIKEKEVNCRAKYTST